MKIALDTNVLAYAEGVNGLERKVAVKVILASLTDATLIAPLQALEEVFEVLTRKAKWPGALVREKIIDWMESTDVVETSAKGLIAAMDLVIRHKLTIWGAWIVAASAEAGCRLLLAEDLQDGFTWRGATAVNPFAVPLPPQLAGAVRP